MKRLLYRLLVVIVLAVTMSGEAFAVADYKVLGEKASRFVKYEEWRSALAMYELMLDQRPSEILPYARGIVVSGVLNDSTLQADLMERSQRYAIPLDSLFANVKEFSFETGQSTQYVGFLNLVKKRQPWIARNIDLRLLDFYVFRNDAANMIKTGLLLLQATPDNVDFLSAVARGYLLQGKYEEAMNLYRRIVELSPGHYDAFLALGNYYQGKAAKDKSAVADAVKYLEAAYKLRPTPYVAGELKKLRK